MELELGLALPNTRHLKEFDLNTTNTTTTTETENISCGKRGFAEAFEKATLQLFAHGDGDDMDGGGGGDGGGDSKRKKLVGWPPVKCVRKRCGSYVGGGGERANYVKVKMEGVAIGRKVDLSLHSSYEQLFHTLDHMFPAAHHDEQTDLNSDDHHNLSRPRRSLLTYDDADGDWLLVGDVPWETFVRSARRLRILR